MSELSKTQIKVLKQLKEKGEFIHHSTTIYSSAWFHSNMKKVNFATFYALRHKGMLIAIEIDWASGKYKISDKGLRAIEVR